MDTPLKVLKGCGSKGVCLKDTAVLSQTGNHLLARVLLLLRYVGGTASGLESLIGFAHSLVRG